MSEDGQQSEPSEPTLEKANVHSMNKALIDRRGKKKTYLEPISSIRKKRNKEQQQQQQSESRKKKKKRGGGGANNAVSRGLGMKVHRVADYKHQVSTIGRLLGNESGKRCLRRTHLFHFHVHPERTSYYKSV